MVRLNPHLRQNYSIFMRNFKQNQHKLSNNHIRFSYRNLLCKFEPPSKKSWICPCFYHLFYFIYMGQPIWDPYGTRLHCPYGCPHGTRDPYGSHIDCYLGVCYFTIASAIPRHRKEEPHNTNYDEQRKWLKTHR